MRIFLSGLFILMVAKICWSQIPEIPTISYVTVNSANQVEINWSVENTANIDGYIVVRRIFGHADAIDGTYHDVATVVGADKTSFTDISTTFGSALPANRQESYRLKAYRMDGTKTIVSREMSLPHNTIHQFEPTFERCNHYTILKWNQYVGWGDKLEEYQVFAKEESATDFQYIASVAGTDTAYIHDTPSLNTNYQYYIKGLHADGTLQTVSNVRTLATTTPQMPSTVTANFATVRDGEIYVNFTVSDSDDVLLYVVQWVNSLDHNPADIGTVAPSESTIEFHDQDHSPTTVNYYRLKVVGICGENIGNSNWTQNIVCTPTILDELTGINQIEWTPFELWPDGVDHYELFRTIDHHSVEQISTLTSDGIQTTDNVGQYKHQSYNGERVAGRFCYYVKAVAKHNTDIEATSNVQCVQYKRFISIPNAINRQSAIVENRSFKPKIAFVSQYLMEIYNRWGKLIYQTENQDTGWNGTMSGAPVVPGVYVYYLEYVDSSGKINKHRGKISVY